MVTIWPTKAIGHAVFVVGKSSTTDCHYPDIDLHLDGATQQFVRKNGSTY